MINLNSRKNQSGFTLLELMVSTAIVSILMAMLVGYVLAMQNQFFNDVVRTRINSNLRAAFDIIGMNIRQSGENLQRSFPAVLLTADSDGVGSYLQLRRNLISDVLTVCETLNAGATAVSVSSTTATDAKCIYANVTSLYDAFNTELTSQNGNAKIFIYNSLTKAGEFVDYTGGSTASAYSLNISAPTQTYEPLSTYLYFIEEYAFSLDEESKTLNLYRNGETDVPEAVAFSISAFNISLELHDSTNIATLTTASTNSWKDLKNIAMTLTGTEAWKSRNFSTTLNGDFFPRNIISR